VASLVSDSVRSYVSLVFLIELLAILGGSWMVMARCQRAFGMVGGGRSGDNQNRSTFIAAICWTMNVAGWGVLLAFHEVEAGTILILLSYLLKVVSLVYARRGYDILYQMDFFRANGEPQPTEAEGEHDD
jgi:hypothetical protein